MMHEHTLFGNIIGHVVTHDTKPVILAEALLKLKVGFDPNQVKELRPDVIN